MLLTRSGRNRRKQVRSWQNPLSNLHGTRNGNVKGCRNQEEPGKSQHSGPVYETFGLVAVLLIRRSRTDALKLSVEAMVMGARHALPVAIACALVGVIIGIINLTGVAATFGGYVIAVGENSLFLALFLTMITCLVLGMGIPTIPNYIITSSLAAPILLELGVPLIVSHMFVFYFGIMADLTPPVALACFAAAPIAKESGLKISFQALRVAIAGFIMPYMAVYAPALMMQGDGGFLAVAYIVFKALLAIGLWGLVQLATCSDRLAGSAD
ncbi:TRAP transporter large permease subunit [Orrella marina]|uniref:TRAP transporter large permease subunit n=1 Tax=Orrella marina TaxID=2163011 RepID=UPI0026D287B9|nr:TRAP transporter large permease subunit [Orrella marina]